LGRAKKLQETNEFLNRQEDEIARQNLVPDTAPAQELDAQMFN